MLELTFPAYTVRATSDSSGASPRLRVTSSSRAAAIRASAARRAASTRCGTGTNNAHRRNPSEKYDGRSSRAARYGSRGSIRAASFAAASRRAAPRLAAGVADGSATTASASRRVVDAGDGQSGERVVAAVRTRGRSRVDAYGSVDDGDVAERGRGRARRLGWRRWRGIGRRRREGARGRGDAGGRSTLKTRGGWARPRGETLETRTVRGRSAGEISGSEGASGRCADAGAPGRPGARARGRGW